jgi:hypothetical protein
MAKFFKSAVMATVAAAAVISGASVARASAVHDIDLTHCDSSAVLNHGAVFMQIDPVPYCTPNLKSIVSLDTKCESTTEKGYNTDGRGKSFNKFDGDASCNPCLTQSLTLCQLGVHYVDCKPYRQFLLDVNEPKGCESTIELTDLKLYLGSSGNEVVKNPDCLGTKIWDMDAKCNLTLDLKDLGHGGKGDYLLSVPDCLFSGPNQFVYLFSKFACAQGCAEQWDAVTGHDHCCHAVPLPPAAYSGFAGLGLLAAGYGLRKRRALAV